MRPFFAFGLAGALAVIAIEIDVLGLQGRAAVFDEIGLDYGRQGGSRDGEGKTSRGGFNSDGSQHPSISTIVFVVAALCRARWIEPPDPDPRRRNFRQAFTGESGV